MTDIEIHTPFIPLDAFLKWAGVADTGGMAKHLVKDGLVSVNGVPCLMRGKKLVPGDTVSVEGEAFRVTGGEASA